MTGGTANKLAAARADTAVVAALTPVCVEKFMQSSDATANLAALQKISTTWEQGDFVVKGGWATRLRLGQGVCREVGYKPKLRPNELKS